MSCVTAIVEVRPVGLDELVDVESLFRSERTTRHCWCMSFCTSRARFAAGWFGGGNRRRFEAMAGEARPMGVLAYYSGVPVGWSACGPRSRYVGATSSRRLALGAGSAVEDDDVVWLLPCLFVHAQYRGQGVSHALLEGAIKLARDQGAVALEGWPLSASETRSADAFVGREQLFAELGFRCVDRLIPGRVAMRLDLGAEA